MRQEVYPGVTLAKSLQSKEMLSGQSTALIIIFITQKIKSLH